jgi:hypothetical protein
VAAKLTTRRAVSTFAARACAVVIPNAYAPAML